jgi:alpha-amylase
VPAKRIALALVLHNHQPVGNFGWVVDEAYQRAYEPMLAALERHPTVRIGLHYTGPLLEWLASERPAFLERLAALAARDQVELLGGGFFEPVLAILPERDRQVQLRRLADAVERIGGRRPAGAWLAERVWEPDVPRTLADAGYGWTILDDTHLRAASVDEPDLHGAFTTDDQGRRLTLLATDRTLRYRVPFGPVEEVTGYLRAAATAEGDRIVVMGDDGEKFGSWPETHEHCWGRGRWVERFFRALERAAGSIVTVTPSAWLAAHPTRRPVYVPTSSYPEMGEWVLPPAESVAFEAALERARAAGASEARWLRGGFWRNYAVRYREINDLHKQMLRASDKVAAMAPGPAREAAQDELGRGQSNDCYWHGVFGGVYLPHLRLATLSHLIAAEDIADTFARAAGRRVDGIVATDIDLDGADEILAVMPGQVVVIDPAEGAGIGSWDIRAARHALASVMRRRPEAYHARLPASGGPVDGGYGTVSAKTEAPTIHGVVRAREAGLAERLGYDDHERRSGLVRILAPGTTADEIRRGALVNLSDAHTGPYAVEATTARSVTLSREVEVPGPEGAAVVRVRKRFSIGAARRSPALGLRVGLAHVSGPPIAFDLAIEWAINLLGGRNPAAYYRIGGRTIGHDSTGERRRLDRVAAGNHDVGIELITTIEPAARVSWSPIETISNSEAGFEANYQGSALVSAWPIRLEPRTGLTVHVQQRVTTAIDRHVTEGPLDRHVPNLR